MGSMDAMRRKVQVIGFGGRRERRFAATVSGTAGAPACGTTPGGGLEGAPGGGTTVPGSAVESAAAFGCVKLESIGTGGGLGTTGCGGGGTGAVVSGADGCGSCGAKSWRESPPF